MSRGLLFTALAILLVALGVLIPPLNTGHEPGPGETPTAYPPPATSPTRR